MIKLKTVGIIPSRYASTRLPGKPLKDICGRPMVWWVYNRARTASKVDEVYVATDDERITRVCEEYDIPYVMTRNDHPTAAHRIQQVSETVKADLYLQLNGDEPLINPDIINAAVVDDVPSDREFGTNIITKMTNPVEVNDVSNIKVVFDSDYNALYMSRTAIPFPSKTLEFDYYKHVGIIGFNKKMLDFYVSSRPGTFESIEGIDTLRFIDYGKTLKLIPVENCRSLSVDTEMDLERVRKIIGEKIEKGEISI